jgi:hypothetical protein
VAVGAPAEILPPGNHEWIWGLQEILDFPSTVFGVERGPARTMMPELAGRSTPGSRPIGGTWSCLDSEPRVFVRRTSGNPLEPEIP